MSRRAWPEEWFKDDLTDAMTYAMKTPAFPQSTSVVTNIPELDHRPFPDVSPCTVYDFIVAEEHRARNYVRLGWARAYTIHRSSPTVYAAIRGPSQFEVPFDTVVLALSIMRLRGRT